MTDENKLSLNITGEVYDDVKRLAVKYKMSQGKVVVKALNFLSSMENEIEKGHNILIEDRKMGIRKEIIKL